MKGGKEGGRRGLRNPGSCKVLVIKLSQGEDSEKQG